MSASPAADQWCPSMPVPHAQRLLGIRGSDGQLIYTPTAIGINDELLENLTHGTYLAENVARFAGPCLNSGCHNWQNSQCQVIESVLDDDIGSDSTRTLPMCGLRPQCRWWAQRGARACAACPEIATVTRASEPRAASHNHSP